MATTGRHRDEPHRLIFIGLALVLAVLLIGFALSTIPGPLRPTLSPTTAPMTSSSP
jgi:hypothetical protein